MKPKIILPVLFSALLPAHLHATAQPAPLPPAEVEFFEKSVRPLLETHCLECHSAAKGKTKGGLAMDTAAGLRKGGTTGSALEAGVPDKSLLITAIRYKDPDLQMPPEKKQLSAERIAVLEEWVKRGAVDPREGKAPGADPELARKHWAFQPLHKPELPQVKQTTWAKTDVDRFVLAGLESKSLPPSAEADRRTLLRRLSYDLTGLPPTLSETETFVANKAPDAYEQAVDRLLASPHFGERWGRHWLDVARYSDTKGLPAPINADRRFHFAYSYRDYVITSYNEDKPFNQFLLEQLAADQIPDSKDPRALAALGFLTVGRCFQNQIHDIIDDRIDVVTRGLMGLSVSCARCHDHKYDPIPTKDYYSLYGVFNSSEEPKERPILGQPQDTPEYQEYLKKRTALLQKEEDGVTAEIKKDVDEIVGKTDGYLLATFEKGAEAELKDLQIFAGQRKLVPLPLSRWAKLLRDVSPQDPVLGPWKVLSALPEDTFGEKAKEQLEHWSSETLSAWNPLLLKALQAHPPTSRKELAETYAQPFKDASKAWDEAQKPVADKPLPSVLPDPEQEALRLTIFKDGAPYHLTRKEAEKLFAKKINDVHTKLHDKVDSLDGDDPGAPPRAMALFDKAAPVNPTVFLRGNPANRGPAVPRQFIGFLAGETRKPFTKGSGRIELAEAISSPNNPLTPRVAVNRIWLHLFGRGLVETPNDFGVRTPAPAIPGLLDYLAARFIEEGWSSKSVIRQLVLSSAYRQSSAPRPDAAEADPNNDLLHAQRRRRLDYESFNDTLQMVSGHLDETIGGRPVELTKAPYPGRRSVYGYIDRQDLPSVLRIFDFANPDISTGQRFETTVPQQALFLLNGEALQNRATTLTQLPEIQAAEAGPARIEALFLRVHLRKPTPTEVVASQSLLKLFNQDPIKPWQALAQVLLLSNETVFVD